jgi:hypothetical protein
MASKFTLDALRPELTKVIGDRTIVLEKLTVQEAYFLMQACQLSETHPSLSQQMKDRFIAIGRRMQELVRPQVSSFFAEFMEAGWHRQFDK